MRFMSALKPSSHDHLLFRAQASDGEAGSGPPAVILSKPIGPMVALIFTLTVGNSARDSGCNMRSDSSRSQGGTRYMSS